MPTENGKSTPPYASFGVFKSTIEQLAQSTVPTGPLDRRVLDQLSGADYGSLMSGLKFLGFIDDDRRATPQFRELVQVSNSPEKFKQFFLSTLNEKYKPIVGSVDVEGGTAAELEKAFRDNGVATGQMLTKTVRFYVKALGECGVQVSPHILKAKPKTLRIFSRNGAPKPKVRRASHKDEHEEKDIPSKPHHAPQGMERMPIPGLAEAFIQYPADLTEAHCDLFVAMIGVLRTYVKTRAGGKVGKP